MSETKTNDPAKMTDQELEIHDLTRKVESLEAEIEREKSGREFYQQVPKLYYNYNYRSDDDIRNFLRKVKIVKAEHKGVGTEYGYYPLTDETMADILSEPRRNSLNFDAATTSDEPLKGLKEYKDIKYLVKSSSRFFLKPDIGEILDQIDFHDWHGSGIKAIVFNPDSYTKLPDTDGEHFVMTATLLVDQDYKIRQHQR